MTRNSETEVTQKAADAAGVENTATADQPTIKGAKLAHEDPALRGGRTDGHILTSEPPSTADQSSWPGGDASIEDPPVRTTRPDVPIVVSLATGAGQHVPPDPDVYTPEGRLRDLT